MPEFGGGALYDIGCYCINLSRMLFEREPSRIEASVTRDGTGTDVLTSAILAFDEDVATFTCSTRAEPDQRVHVYGTEGRISVGIPFNIPPDRPTEIVLTSGGDPPVEPELGDDHVPARRTCTRSRRSGSRRRCSTVGRVPIPPEDAIGNLRVIEAVFGAGAV